MNEKQRDARRRQDDAALNRGLVWVGAAIVLELLLMFVKRYYIDYSVSEESLNFMLMLDGALGVARIVFGVLAVACAVWTVLQLKKRANIKLPLMLMIGAAALALCSHVIRVYTGNGVRMLFMLIPAWAGLALVYYLYQKEFFLAAAAVGMSVLGLWFVRFGGGFCRDAVVMLIGILLVFGASVVLKKGDGIVKLFGAEYRILPKNTNYVTLQASCAAAAAVVLLALVMGTAVAYYLIFLMVAWLFVLLVYYTVKLM